MSGRRWAAPTPIRLCIRTTDPGGVRNIDAWAVNDFFAVHPTLDDEPVYRGWTVTHRQTGFVASRTDTKAQAIRVARCLVRVGIDWDFYRAPNYRRLPVETLDKLQAARRGVMP